MSDSATPWTVAYKAPLSMGFSRQEYWSGVPLPSPYEVQSRQNKNRHASQQIYNPKRDCPGNQLSLRLWLPQEPNMSMQKCYRLVTFFCNYNLITSCPQEMSWCDSGEIIPNSRLSGSQLPTVHRRTKCSVSLMTEGMPVTWAMRHQILPVRLGVRMRLQAINAGERLEKREPPTLSV